MASELTITKLRDFLIHTSTRTLAPLCFLIYAKNFADELLSVPTIRLIEYAVCNRYYQDYDPGSISELECKVEEVQTRVISLLGWLYSVDCIPGIVMALYWGHAADTLGRRVVLSLCCVGQLLAMLALVAICFSIRLPIEMVLLSPLLNFIGGGSRVFISITLAIASHATPYSSRSRQFFFMSMIMDMANITAPPVVSLTLSQDLWFPFKVAAALLAVLCFGSLLIPDPERTFVEEDVISDDDSEQERLLGSIVTRSQEVPIEGQERQGSTGPVRNYRQYLALVSDRNVAILLICVFFKRIGFFSEKFFSQYASERFSLEYSQTAWFNAIQALGAIMALGFILPMASNFLQRNYKSARQVDLIIVRTNLLALALSYVVVGSSWTPYLYGMAIFVCGLGEGAEPALQGFTSSFVNPSNYARLFTSMALLESIGRVAGSPLLALVLRIGRDDSGKPIGMVFMVSAVLFLSTFLASFLLIEEPEASGEISHAEPHKSISTADHNHTLLRSNGHAYERFAKDLPIFEKEVPYELFGYPTGTSNRVTNCEFTTVDNVNVLDTRDSDTDCSLDTTGFRFLHHKSQYSLSAEHFERAGSNVDDNPVVLGYLQESIELLKQEMKADRVICFDWRFRRTGAPPSVLPGVDDIYDIRLQALAPGLDIHCDFSHTGGHYRLAMHLLPDELQDVLDKKWTARIVNLWRPLETVENAPLVIADRRTVLHQDLMEVEKVLPDKVERAYYVKYKPYHQYYYMSAQGAEDVCIFTTWDPEENIDGTAVFPPHGAASYFTADWSKRPRESIEVRAIVMFKNF